MSSTYLVLEEQQSPVEKTRSLMSLAMEMTKADLKARQFQRMLGPMWWILEPLLMAIAYFILTTRLDYTTGSAHFMFIFISTTIWKTFTKSLEISITAYVNFGYVIRQTSFPLLAVNFSHLITELFFFGVGFLFIFAFGAFFKVSFGLPLLALIPLTICQLTLTFGLMVFLACLGVYFRDIASFMGLGLNLVFLASPGIYDVDKVPRFAQYFEFINPFYYLFPAYRQVLLHNQWPDFKMFFVWMSVGILLNLVGFKMFTRVRPNFLRVL